MVLQATFREQEHRDTPGANLLFHYEPQISNTDSGFA